MNSFKLTKINSKKKFLVEINDSVSQKSQTRRTDLFEEKVTNSKFNTQNVDPLTFKLNDYRQGGKWWTTS